MDRNYYVQTRYNREFRPDNAQQWWPRMIIGFDTETMDGPPITVQFYSEHVPKVNACIFVDRENVLKKTLAHLDRHVKGDAVIVGHNLKFDLLSLFYPVCDQLDRKSVV